MRWLTGWGPDLTEPVPRDKAAELSPPCRDTWGHSMRPRLQAGGRPSAPDLLPPGSRVSDLQPQSPEQ